MDKVDYTCINGVHFDSYHPRAAAPRFRYYNTSLSDCYKVPSEAKKSIYAKCKRMCEALNGFNFAITGYNCMFFNVTFDFAHPKTGELMRAHITRYHEHLYHV